MAFKIKHKRTGLFLTTSKTKRIRNPWTVYKTNLVKGGRVYEKCTLEQAKKWFRIYYDEAGAVVEFNIDDFELVEI